MSPMENLTMHHRATHEHNTALKTKYIIIFSIIFGVFALFGILIFVGSIVLLVTESDDLEAHELSSEMGESQSDGEDEGEEEGEIGRMNKSGWRFVKGERGLSYRTAAENAVGVAQGLT